MISVLNHLKAEVEFIRSLSHTLVSIYPSLSLSSSSCPPICMLLSNGKRCIHTKATSNTQLILVQAQNVISKSCCYTEFAFEVVTNEENHLAEIIIIPESKMGSGIHCCPATLTATETHTAIKSQTNTFCEFSPWGIIIVLGMIYFHNYHEMKWQWPICDLNYVIKVIRHAFCKTDLWLTSRELVLYCSLFLHLSRSLSKI